MECLGPGLGSDEQGCYVEEETPSPFKHTSSQATQAKEETHTEKTDIRDLERSVHLNKPLSSDRSSEVDDLLALLKREEEQQQEEEEDEESQEDQEQTQKPPSVTPVPIEWPCGGLLQNFYGTFSPPSQRGPALNCVWTLDPQDSRPLRLDLQQLVLGSGDKLTIYNRQQGKGDILKIVSLEFCPCSFSSI